MQNYGTVGTLLRPTRDLGPNYYLHATGQPPLGPMLSWCCSYITPVIQVSCVLNQILFARLSISRQDHSQHVASQSPTLSLVTFPNPLLFKLDALVLTEATPNLTSSPSSLSPDLVYQVISNCLDATPNPALTESFPPETSPPFKPPSFSISGTSPVSLLPTPVP